VAWACAVLLTAGAAEATTFSLKAVKKNPTCIAGLVGEFCATDRQCDTVSTPPSLDGVCGGNIPPTNNITARVGDQIVAEIYVSDWSPQGQEAHLWQATVDIHSFFSGSSGAVLPVGWDRPPWPPYPYCFIYCESDSDCPAEWPVCQWNGMYCSGPNHEAEQSFLLDTTRADYVFAGKVQVWAVDYTLYRMGSVLFNPLDVITYTPPPKYCGTLALEARPGASGTFAISLLDLVDANPDPVLATFVADEQGEYTLPLVLEPLTVTVRTWPPIKVTASPETE